MIRELQEAFKHVAFYEKNHIYVNINNGEVLPSVTGYIKKFQPEFNEQYWLGEKAGQRGISPEELKKEWSWLSKIGVEMGSALHSFLEQKIQRRHIVPTIPSYLDKDKFEILIKQATEYVESIQNPVLACEFVMCNYENTLAGMCDRLSLSENNKIVITDYKTGQLKDSYGKFHSKPYNTLEASSLGKYTLQLNFYKSFLEARGFEVEKLEIVWFNENNPTYQIIDVPKIEIK